MEGEIEGGIPSDLFFSTPWGRGRPRFTSPSSPFSPFRNNVVVEFEYKLINWSNVPIEIFGTRLIVTFVGKADIWMHLTTELCRKVCATIVSFVINCNGPTENENLT